jgi:hypothetical protein
MHIKRAKRAGKRGRGKGKGKAGSRWHRELQVLCRGNDIPLPAIHEREAEGIPSTLFAYDKFNT